MTDLEAKAIFKGFKFLPREQEAVDYCLESLDKINKIRAITERALRSSDPINLYKALCIKAIAEIVEIKAPDPVDTDKKDQITIDDII